MKNRRIAGLVGIVMCLSLGAVGDRADADDGGDKLVTSSVDLEPILFGRAPDDPDASFDPGKSYDGALAIVIDTPYQIWTAMGTYVHVAAFDHALRAVRAATRDIFFPSEGNYAVSPVTALNRYGGFIYEHIAIIYHLAVCAKRLLQDLFE